VYKTHSTEKNALVHWCCCRQFHGLVLVGRGQLAMPCRGANGARIASLARERQPTRMARSDFCVLSSSPEAESMEPLAIAQSELAVTGGSKHARRNEQEVKAMGALTGEESIRWGELKRKHFPPRPVCIYLT